MFICIKLNLFFLFYHKFVFIDIDVNVGTFKEQRKGYIPAISEREKGI